MLLRALEARGRLDSTDRRIAVGWLIVEDLVMVLALVLLPAAVPALGGGPVAPAQETAPSLLVTLGLTLGKVAAFVSLMLIAGARLFPWLLAYVARTESRELFTLAVTAIALGIAFSAAQGTRLDPGRSALIDYTQSLSLSRGGSATTPAAHA